jgi:hypothetical protein
MIFVSSFGMFQKFNKSKGQLESWELTVMSRKEILTGLLARPIIFSLVCFLAVLVSATLNSFFLGGFVQTGVRSPILSHPLVTNVSWATVLFLFLLSIALQVLLRFHDGILMTIVHIIFLMIANYLFLVGFLFIFYVILGMENNRDPFDPSIIAIIPAGLVLGLGVLGSLQGSEHRMFRGIDPQTAIAHGAWDSDRLHELDEEMVRSKPGLTSHALHLIRQFFRPLAMSNLVFILMIVLLGVFFDLVSSDSNDGFVSIFYEAPLHMSNVLWAPFVIAFLFVLSCSLHRAANRKSFFYRGTLYRSVGHITMMLAPMMVLYFLACLHFYVSDGLFPESIFVSVEEISAAFFYALYCYIVIMTMVSFLMSTKRPIPFSLFLLVIVALHQCLAFSLYSISNDIYTSVTRMFFPDWIFVFPLLAAMITARFGLPVMMDRLHRRMLSGESLLASYQDYTTPQPHTERNSS